MSTNNPTTSPVSISKTVVWLVCIVASIGFAFDIYELLMLPLILKSAMVRLGGYSPGTTEYISWARTLFFVPALVGGVFGLLGGYLTDYFGRRRVLTFSILLYAFSAFAAGFSTNLYHLLICRCLVFIGVCVEFVAAVAWLAELFTDPKQRERVLGFTQAFSSLGGILVAGANELCGYLAESKSLPAIHGLHEAWRYTLISGVIPAIPLIVIRPFLPESPAWQAKRNAGTLKRPSIMELFSPALAKTTIITTLMFAASYGIAFGAIQQLPQILTAPNKGHQQVIAEGKAAVAAAKAKTPDMTEAQVKATAGNANDRAAAKVTQWQELGGLVGRVAFALIALVAISRRNLFRLFNWPSVIFVPLLFWWISNNLATDSLSMIKVGIFVAGFLVVAQFSFWGNYIPLVFPVHLRGTGESFAANIGGRVIGTFAAWLTLTLSDSSPPDPSKIAMVGAFVAGGYAVLGGVLSFMLPEPGPEAHE